MARLRPLGCGAAAFAVAFAARKRRRVACHAKPALLPRELPAFAKATAGMLHLRSAKAKHGGLYWARTSDLFHVKEAL